MWNLRGEVELGVSLWVRCLAPGSSGIAWVRLEEFRLLDRVAPVPYPTGDWTLERKKAVRRAAKILTDRAAGTNVNVCLEGRTTWPFWVKSLPEQSSLF